MMDSSDQTFSHLFPSEDTSMRMHQNGTETWFVSSNSDVPSPMSPGDMTPQQTANVLTLLTTTSSFEVEFAFAEPKYAPFTMDPEGCPTTGGRNILFEAEALPACASPPPAPPRPPPLPPMPPAPPPHSPHHVTRQFSWRWWHDGDSPDVAGWDSVQKTCEERAGRLCRYKEICPKGPGHQPNGGMQKEEEVAFSPYARADGAPDYVFIGVNGTCESLLDTHGATEVEHVQNFTTLPGSEVKEDFMCCSGDVEYPSYPFMRWLHTGQHYSWQQAEAYCHSPPAEFPTLNYTTRLCNYQELCPWGELHPPQGSYPEEGSQWTPYRRADGMNGGLDYVSTGTGEDGACVSLCNSLGCRDANMLSQVTHEMKRYIACCA